jgi:hypothetical protein
MIDRLSRFGTGTVPAVAAELDAQTLRVERISETGKNQGCFIREAVDFIACRIGRSGLRRPGGSISCEQDMFLRVARA